MIYFMYSRATKGGGALVKTTKSGGGTTATSSAGGGVSTSTASGGGSSQTSSAGGGTKSTTSTRSFAQLNLMTLGPETVSGSYHVHEVQIPGDRFNHSHDITIGSHTHSVTIPSHTHNFDVPNHHHDVTIPNHSHEIELPDHTHEIEHAIYTLDRLPTACKIVVDGNTVPHTAISGTNIDLIDYLKKDDSGKVTRGWHTIDIEPNDLAYINAQVTTKVLYAITRRRKLLMSLVIAIATQDFAIIAGDHRCTHISDDAIYHDAVIKVFNVNNQVVAGFTGDLSVTEELVKSFADFEQDATIEQVAEKLKGLTPSDAYLTIILSGVDKNGNIRIVEMGHRDNFAQHITDIPEGEVRWLSSYAYVSPNDMIEEEFAKLSECNPQEVAEMLKRIVAKVSEDDIRVSKNASIVGIIKEE
ncbi:hypothetical protein [Cytobacillus sp. FSL R7-0680]|uniref:hypothetical protein n=1 Tax=Cytobacillus sp. FSL R7-0680 TaxID=2921689 RepID=UPI0030F70166